jgi:hypothetical protein
LPKGPFAGKPRSYSESVSPANDDLSHRLRNNGRGHTACSRGFSSQRASGKISLPAGFEKTVSEEMQQGWSRIKSAPHKSVFPEPVLFSPRFLQCTPLQPWKH